jgi:transposase
MMKPKIVTTTEAELDELLALAKGSFPAEKYVLLESVLRSFASVMLLLQNAKTSIKRLRRALFGSRTEDKDGVLGKVIDAKTKDSHDQTDSLLPAIKRDGHGRNGAKAYSGASVIRVDHSSLRPGLNCAGCLRGKVYTYDPKIIVRVVGQPPLAATVYQLGRLRCNLCGEIFTAEAPHEMGADKYDVSAASMLALLRYGAGTPFYRLEGLQACLNMPLPDATQWDIVSKAADGPRAVYGELIRQAAQGELLHNDDTPMRILALMGKRAERAANDDEKQRAVNTSGIVAVLGEHQMVLFVTGPKHAGENLRDVLAHRAETLPPPMQMCDGLSHNTSGEFKTILGNCLVHGRRQFIDIVDSFPAACRQVIEVLGKVYQNEAYCREQKLSNQARLHHHQALSGPLMESLNAWMTAQLEARAVEPNSNLGKAFNYMLKRWSELTLFLRQAGAPLDNNICERALKKAILHRKGSLFYKTQNGAIVGDVYMSLIHTCQLCGKNPFDYLQALQTHVDNVKRQPHLWLPWNYAAMIVNTT